MNTKAAPIILVDGDSTLVDWDDSGYNHHALSIDPTLAPITREMRTSWSWMMKHPERVRKAALHAPGFYSGLVPYEGAAKALREMRKAGLDPRICTTPYPTHATCASEKLDNYERHFGHEMAVKTILTNDKTIINGALLIDDKPEITGAMTPTWERVWRDQPYNAGLPGLRISNWADWESVILPELERLGY